MAGLFDNFDSNNLMSLGGMLLSAGAPSTQGVGERLGAGFQQYAAQQKQAGMQALQKKYLEGQISAQQLAAETAKLENRLKQQDLDIYNQYAPNSSSPQIPSTPPMPGQPPMPLGSLPSGGAPMPIGEMPQGTAGPIGPAQMGPRANLPGLQPPQGQGLPPQVTPQGLPPLPPSFPPEALAASSRLRALQEARVKQYEAQRQRTLDQASLEKDRREAADKSGQLYGSGEDGRARARLLTGDPSSKTYASDWKLLAQPKDVFDPKLGRVVTTRPDMSAYDLPTYGRGSGSGGTSSVGGVSVSDVDGAGQMTAAESKAAGYADRAFEANKTLATLDVQGAEIAGRLAESGGYLGNYAKSDTYKQFEQSRRNFITAVLRPQSGATITEEEFASADKQYFPQPGDDKETVAQKRLDRAVAAQNLAREAGKQYTLPDGVLPIVRNDSDWTRLPKGTEYISPKGQRMRKK
jgi:hypothetical protein